MAEDWSARATAWTAVGLAALEHGRWWLLVAAALLTATALLFSAREYHQRPKGGE